MGKIKATNTSLFLKKTTPHDEIQSNSISMQRFQHKGEIKSDHSPSFFKNNHTPSNHSKKDSNNKTKCSKKFES